MAPAPSATRRFRRAARWSTSLSTCCTSSSGYSSCARLAAASSSGRCSSLRTRVVKYCSGVGVEKSNFMNGF